MGNIVEILIKYLFKKDIIKFLKIENSFFLYKKLDKKINLSKDIIKLNYLKESPFAEEENSITSILSEKNLFLWFHKGNQQRYLPEALLVYRQLLKEHQNVICIIEGDIEKIILIKEQILISSFSKRKITKNDILLLKEEYGIDKVITIPAHEYDDFLEKSYKFITIYDLLNILNIQIDFKSLSTRLLMFMALPLLISSIAIGLLMGTYFYFLKEEENRLKEEFLKNKMNTLSIKNSVTNNRDENIQFNLLSNEFKYYEKTTAISNIIQVTKDLNMTMYYIKLHENKVDFIVRVKKQKDIPIYVKRLFKSECFVDVKNISSSKLRDDRVQITMTATLKER